MSFRARLALFLAVSLAAVQLLTAGMAYLYLRHSLVQRGERELTAEMGVFTRQLEFFAERVTDAVKASSLDYALRAAIAQHNHDTELSALRNHSQRIGASRMMLVALDGSLEVDTAAPQSGPGRFRFAGLLSAAAANDQAAALTGIDGRAYWLVAVPVRAPVPIGFIAAFIPVDDALLVHLRALSAEPRGLLLATMDREGRWRTASRNGLDGPTAVVPLPRVTQQVVIRETVELGHHYLTAVSRLAAAAEGAPVVAQISYPLDEALAAYRSLVLPLLALLAVALVAGVIGILAIVRGAARPLESLAAAARRIASGNYAALPRLPQRDEIGHLSDALSHMTRAIADREAALRQALDTTEIARNEAVSANCAKSQFLANMSHELRTPLNAVVGFSEMIEHQIVGPINQRYADYAHDIRDSAGKLLDLVERMLDLAEIEGERLRLTRALIKPAQILQEAAGALGPLAQKNGVKLNMVAPAHSSSVEMEGDAIRLKRAFTNIVHNAVKFTSAGGEVRVTCSAENGSLSICVADTGTGIQPDLLASVVRPFHRLRSALDGRHQGAGLGLPFAKAIVELHGGHLQLQSELGVGTTATIHLPVRNSAMSRAA
ncbi:MAG: HAMP domain-containing histidine kinase [Alphaproteobacteria bacterium]|nr:HAMP domain-containing histidine kinase [Alphaproteobacteria bacterium]